MKKPIIIIISLILILALASAALTTNPSMMRNSMMMNGSVQDAVVQMPMGMSKEMAMIEPAMPMPYAGGVAMDSVVRYNQYFASYGLVVNNVDEYFQSIKSYITSIDGVVISSNRNKNDRYSTAVITARVPIDRFDEATRKVTEGVEDVMQESISANDVTDQVVSQTEELERLKTDKADAEITLENATTDAEKRRIQIQIDQLEKQIAFLEESQENTTEQVEYGTIDIQISDDKKYFGSGTEEFDFEAELERAVRSMRGVLTLGVVVAIWAVVYSVVLIPAWLIIRWLKRKMTKPVQAK